MKLALALVLAIASSAHADPKQAAAEYAEGQRQFKAKEYVKAADRFKAAFAADEDPVYLFNIAQALRHAKQCTESRDYYRKFLAAAAVIPNRDKVELWLAEVEACATPEKPAEPPPPIVAVPVKPPLVVQTPSTSSPPGEDRGRGRRRVGLIAIGGGVIAASAGVFFTTRVKAAVSDREALCPMPCTWTDDLARRERALSDKGKQSSTLAITSFAVGGAALVGGLVVYLTGRRASAERVSITPVASGAIARVGFEF